MTTAIATKKSSGALLTLDQIGSTSLSTAVLDSLTKSGDYLDRIQLFQGTSALAKEDKIKAGYYGVPKNDDVEVLGPSIDLLVFAAKPKALDTSGDTPVAAHDPESAEFKRIKEQAETVKDSGCMYGLEFLVFERNSGKFYTYFANSASARREAGKMIPNKEILAVTLGATFVKKRQYSWHAPTVTKCSTDFANFPTLEAIRAEVEKFSKADENAGEEVGAADAPAAKNRRAR